MSITWNTNIPILFPLYLCLEFASGFEPVHSRYLSVRACDRVAPRPLRAGPSGCRQAALLQSRPARRRPHCSFSEPPHRFILYALPFLSKFYSSLECRMF